MMVDNRRLIVSAIVVITAVLALILITEVFSFQIDANSSEGLEKALHDCLHIEIKVLETEPINDLLFVVYGQAGHPYAGGLACFQKGYLGKCRFVFAHHYNSPLIFAERTQPYVGNYLVGFAFDYLGESPSLGCTVGEDASNCRTYYFSHPGKPFVQVELIRKNDVLIQKAYYDLDLSETEIDPEWLELHSDQDTPMMSSDAAELCIVRFAQLIILLMGLITLWTIYRKSR